MKTTYICNSEAKTYVLDRLLEKAENGSLEDTEIKSLSAFRNAFLKEPPTAEEICEIGRGLSDSELDPLLSDSGFLREIRTIADECERYKIDPETLELPSAIRHLLKAIPLRGYASLPELTLPEENIQIVKDHYSLFDQELITILKEKGASEIDLIDMPEHKDYRYETGSVADQYEYAVQRLILQDLPLSECAFLLCDTAEKDLCFSTLKRYEIPCYSPDLLNANTAAADLTALLDFCFAPDLPHYKKVLERNLFAKANAAAFVYLNDHMREEDLFRPLQRLSDDPDYRETEKSAEYVHSRTWPKLKELCEAVSYKEKLIKAFSFLKEGEDKEAVRYYLQERGPSLKEEHYGLLKEALLKLGSSVRRNNGIRVSSFADPCYGFKYLFVFSCSESLFPGFQPKEGLLNEYLLKDTNYPDIALREKDHLQKLAYLERSEKTFYLLPLSSYDGKAQSFSLNLEHIPLESGQPLKSSCPLPNTHKLTAETAGKLFFDEEGVLNGSVSAFESYSSCPYAYFLNYGLGLREPRVYGFEPATIGTILHGFFEQLVKDRGKDYAKISEEEIRERLQPYRKRFETLYPRKQQEISHLFDNMTENLKLELAFLAKMESETRFAPKEQEYRFKEMFTDNEYARVRLRGSIDRVDECGDYFRILDYKTSKHALKEGDIRAGVSLQLLTYLFLYAGISGKEGLSAYYCDLNLTRQREDRYGYTKSKGFAEKEITQEEAFYHKQKLSGWALQDVEGVYDSYDSIPTGGAKGRISTKQLYDGEKIYSALQTIYTVLYQKLANGEIPLEPAEGACSYCLYGAICRFKGKEGYTVRQYFDGSLKQEEEEKEA
ncbi:MAG: PD-(D/E)XK nuclease family protein [Erysipelotrichaceae bacterium]|nr:PD-(D/E)XK nuclease family protein [Erysipelotrichaceae bacterium]